VEEARRLWRLVGRANVMIKVPATLEGIPAIARLTTEGINVNVTLLFAQERYEQVANAYLTGLEQRVARGEDICGIASVASFFVSRIDTAVDALLMERLKSSTSTNEQVLLRRLLGKVAIANAKLAYQRYLRLRASERWRALAGKGAQTQRLLWASTSTKNPRYRDVLYVEALIGPDTIDTMPPATLAAFREHGQVRESLTTDLEDAQGTLDSLARVGISLSEVTEHVLAEGVRLFAEPFDKLLRALEKMSVGAVTMEDAQDTGA